MANDHMIVSANSSKNPDPVPSNTKPEHWVDKAGSAFVNPWKSWKAHSALDRLSALGGTLLAGYPTVPKNITELITISKPDWGANPQAHSAADSSTPEHERIKTTWLGHACFLVEFPSRQESPDARGIRVLFDPVFSDRCSPVQFMGPKRFTPPPCKIEDIPEIDAVVISHNHYDHLDTHTIKTLLRRSPRTPHFFAPLGNGAWFKALGVPTSNTHIMDWWDSKHLSIEIESKSGNKCAVDITCTPNQHFTGRTPFDMFKTLWAGWVVEEAIPVASESKAAVEATEPGAVQPGGRPPVKVYFAGDTAYRSVLDGQDENQVPVCPAFKTIGETFGGFDCALIPIGAYLPRDFMSRIHCAPQDSVLLFKDIKAKRALGMHWGTWILTTEDVVEPPKRLAEECKKAGIEDDAFTTCDIGQTLWF